MRPKVTLKDSEGNIRTQIIMMKTQSCGKLRSGMGDMLLYPEIKRKTTPNNEHSGVYTAGAPQVLYLEKK